jgi:maltooligosyltrehalose synthase
LNLLGLSTQVPAQWQYFSDGPSKTYEWDGGTLVFKHRTNKETTVLSPKTALLVQALKALGQNHIDDSVMDTLRARFDKKERARAIREARYATSWVYEIIKRLAAQGEAHHA